MSLQHDLRHGIRILVHKPVVTLVILLTLALGSGGSVAIFGVVQATLLRPLPYPDPDRLVMVWWANEQNASIPVSPLDLRDWREQSGSFETLAAYHPWSYTITEDGEPERLRAAVVTAGMLELLGAKPRLGGLFRSDGPDAAATVILSHELWQRRFGGDPEMLGKKLILDGEPFEVQGVLPEGFHFPSSNPAELFEALRSAPDDLPRDMRYLRVLGRLNEGTSLESAQAEMTAVAAGHELKYPDTNDGLGARVETLRSRVVEDFERALLLLQLAVLLVLAIACFNVAILQAARMQGRSREIATRLTLGASRGQIVRQLLSENLALGLAGGVLGLGLAQLLTRWVIRFGPDVYRLDQTSLDARVLGFALAVAVASGLVFGLAPAVHAWRQDFAPMLREGGRGSTHAGRWRNLFVFLQVAVTLVLLVGAGLLIRSFDKLRAEPTGFRADHLLTLQVNLPESQGTIEQTSAFYRQLKERVEALPGVESFATAVSLPLGGGMQVDNSFDIEGRPRTASDPQRQAQIRPVSPGFFELLEIPRLAGRTFDQRDGSRSPPVVVINEKMARTYWPGEDPVGARIQTQLDLGGSLGSLAYPAWEVVGVVENVKHQGLDGEPQPEIYFSTSQSPWCLMTLLVRTSLDPEALIKPVAAELHALAPNLPLTRIRTMDEILDASLSQSRFRAWLLGFFAVFALVLTAVGLYAVLSYSVVERSREIGLRMALGARRDEVVRLVVRRGMALSLAGLGLGLVGAFLLVRALTGLLFGISAVDPPTYIVVSLLLGGVALAASYFPARRAAGLDPVITLRYD